MTFRSEITPIFIKERENSDKRETCVPPPPHMPSSCPTSSGQHTQRSFALSVHVHSQVIWLPFTCSFIRISTPSCCPSYSFPLSKPWYANSLTYLHMRLTEGKATCLRNERHSAREPLFLRRLLPSRSSIALTPLGASELHPVQGKNDSSGSGTRSDVCTILAFS